MLFYYEKICLNTMYGKQKKEYKFQGAAAPLLQLVPVALSLGTAEAVSATTGGAGATGAGGTSEAEGTGANSETARNSESERGNLGEFWKIGLSVGTPTFFKATFHPSVHALSRIPGNCAL